ncbi:hypothetical protein HORIV_16940 [Vreelandella olivaria]|uniref:Uncharacterized protein n=1 Tax=Vreelandella olivaria TaxID=390919 RepID=A0ABM7GEY1_9GAMM|nr:hypothetical protein HORIV_16940 [Halomonas olivaria]
MNKCLSWRKVLPLLGCSFLFVTPSVFAIDYDVNGTNVSLYGYAKLDVMYDSGDVKTGNSNGMGDSVNFSKIAVDGQPSTSGHSNLHANESRLGIRTTTPTEKGDLITNIEGDFSSVISGCVRPMAHGTVLRQGKRGAIFTPFSALLLRLILLAPQVAMHSFDKHNCGIQ